MDHRRFLKYFLQEERLLRTYLLAAIRDPVEVDDVLQNVSSVLWEKFAEYDESRPFRSWALGVARLEVLKHRQRYARSREVLSGDALEVLAVTADEQADDLDRRRRFLRQCLGRLRDGARRLLAMKYRDGLRASDIADRVGKSVGAVEMALVRIRRRLRDCIERRLARDARGNP